MAGIIHGWVSVNGFKGEVMLEIRVYHKGLDGLD